MNYKTLLTSLGFALTLLISACNQAPEALQAPRLEPQFGTAADDYATDVAVQKRLGHVYVAGQLGDKVFLRQYKRNGTLNWQRLLSERSSYAARAMAVGVDDSGNVYLAWSRGGGYENSFISKYRRNGTLIWRKRFSNLLNMAVDAQGNLYLVGVDSVRKHTPTGALVWQDRPNLAAGFITAVAVAPSGNVIASDQNADIIKYDNDGNNARQLFYGFYDVYVRDLALGPNEEIYLGVGVSYEDGEYTGPTIFKFSAEGRLQWSSYVVNPSFRATRVGVATDSQGNAYLTGSYACATFDYDSCDTYSPNAGDAFVRKLTPEGTALWTRRFGTSRYDSGSAVALLSDNELYVAGYTEGSLIERNRGGSDAFLRKMNGSSDRIWTR